jgi:hypothetical protein
MENIWAVLMGRQFFCMSTVGPPNKQMMLLKPVLCFIQQQEVVESQQIQPTGEQLRS